MEKLIFDKHLVDFFYVLNTDFKKNLEYGLFN